MMPKLRVFLVAGALAPATAFSQQAVPAGGLYAARVVGDWTVTGESGARPLLSLGRVLRSESVGVRAGARVDSSYTLVLRDPRTLRSATWSCNPVARCAVVRPVSQLTLEGAPIPTSPRTSALFVHVGEDAEERSRVKLVGARGAGGEWKLLALAVDSGFVDVRPLASRLGSDLSGVVARICPLVGEPAASTRECADGRQLRATDCEVAHERCSFKIPGGKISSMSVELFTQVNAELSAAPIARAFGVITAKASYQRYADLADAYQRDLDALGAWVSDAELRALEAAAAASIARARF